MSILDKYLEETILGRMLLALKHRELKEIALEDIGDFMLVNMGAQGEPRKRNVYSFGYDFINICDIASDILVSKVVFKDLLNRA